jgi:hypothetical protein
LESIYGIFGTGRSGSTWLGSIVDSHPEVAYRFEPFHRLRKNGRLDAIRSDAEKGKADATTLSVLYRTLLPADPITTRAPFFPKSNRRSIGIDKAWALARSSALAAPMYRALYTPRAGAPLIFKEVTLEGLMERLVLDAGLRVVYLVRHPCAVVSSLLRGQARGLMPSARRKFLPERLDRDEPDLLRRRGSEITQLSGAEQEALLWRLDVAKGFELSRTNPRVLLVVYEDLCERPKEIARQVLAHFELDMTSNTARAIDEMTSPREGARRDKWADRYFTVFRDPKAASERWRTELDPADQQAVIRMVEDSPAFEYARGAGLWS